MQPADADPLDALLAPPSPYVAQVPFAKQQAALVASRFYREVFYGGAAGGGKSSVSLMKALDGVHLPGFSSLILRRTFSQLTKRGGLVDRADDWLKNTDADWNGEKMRWSFPSGAAMEFGHCQHHKNIDDYQSSEYNVIVFEELTQFTPEMYKTIGMGRSRGSTDAYPVSTFGTGNPGGVSHRFVNDRFGCAEGLEIPADGVGRRLFIKSLLSDNPILDQEEYTLSLMELDPLTRERWLNGDWSVTEAGGFFKAEWFNVIDEPHPLDAFKGGAVRYYDLAATKRDSKRSSHDPDWTRGALGGMVAGRFVVQSIVGCREEPAAVRAFLRRQGQVDGPSVRVVIEEEGGASGKIASADIKLDLHGRGVSVASDRVTGSKMDRAVPLANAAEQGLVDIVAGPWVETFLREADHFGSEAEHDDTIDACSGLYNATHRAWGWDGQLAKYKKRAEVRATA